MNQRSNKRVPYKQSYRAPPTTQCQPSQQQSNYQNLSFVPQNVPNGPSQPYFQPSVHYVQGYDPPPMQHYPVQQYPMQQYPVQQYPMQQYTNPNTPQIGYGCYPPQHFPPQYPSTSTGPQNFVPQPPPPMQYDPGPAVYYTEHPQGFMNPNPPPIPMMPPPIQYINRPHQRLETPPPSKPKETPATPKIAEKPKENKQENDEDPEIVSDALRELKIQISVLESVVRYQEKSSPMDTNQQMVDAYSGIQQNGEMFDSRPSSVATYPKKSGTPETMKHVVTEIKQCAHKVDKLMKQEQYDSKNSDKPPEIRSTHEDVKNRSISPAEPVIPPVSPAPSDPTMPAYSPPPPPPVKIPAEKSPPPKPIEKKPIDYSQWVDVKKQHKKWKDEVQKETEPKTIKVHILARAKEIPSVPFKITSEVSVEDTSVLHSEAAVEKKKKNRPKKKKKDNQQKGKEDEDFDEFYNDEAQVSSLFNDEPDLIKNKLKGKKVETEAEEEEDQGKYHEEQIRKILPSYSFNMKNIRQSHYLFEKERGTLPDFQMEIINYWKHNFLFGLPERFRRQGIYRKLLQRILMYRSNPALESQKMFFFLESLGKTRDAQDEVINADLLFIYEADMEDSLLREQEKKYYDTIMTFTEWRPKTWNRVPVLIQDLKRIPVSIEEERLQKFHNLINKQGLRRMICNSAPEIKETYTCSVEEVIHIAHLSSRGQENNWSTFDTRDFLTARLVVLREEEQTPETLMHIQLYEFLLHVTSSVLNFNVFWLKSCFQYSDGRATPNGEDSLLKNLFW